jgi:hypothetical protein
MAQDKLGCYRIGDLKFYSKLEAIEMHTKTGIHPHWDFNEAVFSSYDWTVEPSENILELYRQRAVQLREKYDHIVLMYSGGADSTTMLESFVNNGLHVDEVASYINYDATGDKDNYLNAEIFRVSINKIDQLKEKYPWLKYRLIDLTELTLDLFGQSETKFNWIYDMNMFFNPNAAARDQLALKVKEWADIIHAGKKFCIVWAHDKPRIQHENNRWTFKFIDLIDNGPTVKSISGQNPYTDELFYWSPDLPKIVIKQCHLIKNYLSNELITTLPFVSQEKSDLAYRTINGVKHWLNNHGVHSLIYPNWDIDTFSNGKPNSIIFSDRDIWFYNIENENHIKKNWAVGLDKLWKVLPDYWKNTPDDLNNGLKACWSKEYYLERV